MVRAVSVNNLEIVILFVQIQQVQVENISIGFVLIKSKLMWQSGVKMFLRIILLIKEAKWLNLL